jgi:hypothetical protein
MMTESDLGEAFETIAELRAENRMLKLELQERDVSGAELRGEFLRMQHIAENAYLTKAEADK